jgi:hypothetical protein
MLWRSRASPERGVGGRLARCSGGRIGGEAIGRRPRGATGGTAHVLRRALGFRRRQILRAHRRGCRKCSCKDRPDRPPRLDDCRIIAQIQHCFLGRHETFHFVRDSRRVEVRRPDQERQPVPVASDAERPAAEHLQARRRGIRMLSSTGVYRGAIARRRFRDCKTCGNAATSTVALPARAGAGCLGARSQRWQWRARRHAGMLNADLRFLRRARLATPAFVGHSWSFPHRHGRCPASTFAPCSSSALPVSMGSLPPRRCSLVALLPTAPASVSLARIPLSSSRCPSSC